jgi:hypothetical protein
MLGSVNVESKYRRYAVLFDPNWKPKTEVIDMVGDLMLKAADYLETHRWAQGNLVKANGAVCLVGSLFKVATGRVYQEYADNKSSLLALHARDRILNYLNEIPEEWNDDHRRKKSEVVAVLRKAAKLRK